MPNKDSTQEYREALFGDDVGFQEKHYRRPLGVLARLVNYTVGTFKYVNLAPGESYPFLSLKEFLERDFSPPSNPFRVLPVDLSARLTDSSTVAAQAPIPLQLHLCLKRWIQHQKKSLHMVHVSYLIHHKEAISRPSRKKDTPCVSLKSKYKLTSFQVTEGSQEEKDKDSPQARITRDALISTLKNQVATPQDESVQRITRYYNSHFKGC